jgi:hypothetical protein
LLRYAGYGPQTVSRRRPARQRPRARLSLEALEDRTVPSTFVVDRLTDTGAGEGLAGDLRYCLGQANANPGDDSITFSVTGTINLTGALPSLSSNIDLEGPGASSLTVRRDTGGSYRIFTVDSGATVVLSGLSITNGYVSSSDAGGGIYNSGTLTLNNATVSGNTAYSSYDDGWGAYAYGGGLYNSGMLTLNNATVSDNAAETYAYRGEAFGGGIYNSYNSTVTLNNSIVSGNTAYSSYYNGLGDYGGGIYNFGTLMLSNATVSGNSVSYYGYGGGIDNEGTLTLNNATVSGNSAGQGGGGIFNYAGTVTLNNATVSGNSAGYGGGIVIDSGTVTLNYTTISGNSTTHGGAGGIANSGTLTLNNTTVSGNSVGPPLYGGYGGGIANSGTLTLNNTTVSGNSAIDYGGGIDNYMYGGTLTTRNTIIAGNTAHIAPDLEGSLGSLGHNLIGNTSGGSGFDATDLLNVNPLLGPLQDNGGPTKTMALLAGSPALNAGDPDQLGVADQRGVLRSGGVNIGAYQASASAFALTAPATVTAGTPFDLTVKAVDPFGQTALGYRGTARFASSDGQADLPGDYTFVAADNGVHTFPGGVTLNTAGDQTVTATDTSTSSLTGSAPVAVSATPSNQPQDPSFETPPVGTGTYNSFQYHPASAWTFSTYAGVAGNGSGFTAGNPAAPDGTQVAFLQGPSSASQSFPFLAGTYSISFLAAQRANYQYSSQTVQVQVDGTAVGTFTPAGTSYAAYNTAGFTVTAGAHTIAFVGTDPDGADRDNTAFIDQVRINRVLPVLQDPGFEMPPVGTGACNSFQYNPSGSLWTFDDSSGVAGNGSGFTGGNPDAPDGTQVAFLQGVGSFSQSVTLAAGTYSISFSAAQRANFQYSSQTVQVQVDGTAVGTFTLGSASYAAYTTASFTVTAGSHTLRFVGLDPDGADKDNTAFIDQVFLFG